LSISKIRNSFDSKGCQVVLVVVGLLLAVGLLYTGTCQALTGAGQPADGTQPVIVVDGRPISDRALGDAVRRSQELTFQNTGGFSSPASDFYAVGGAIDSLLRQTVIQSLLDKRGAKVADEDVRQASAREFEQQIELFRGQAEMSGQLKRGATDAEFEKWFKDNNNGQSIAEAKKARVANIEQTLKDPARAEELRRVYAQSTLLSLYAKESPVTETDLRQSYDEFTFKVLRFTGTDGAARTKKAEEALAEIKGGAKVEDVAKKRLAKSAETVPLGRVTADTVTYLKGLTALKVGEAMLVEEPDSASVYVLEKVAPKLPEGYERDRQRLLEEFRERKAIEKLQDDIEAALSGDRVQWKAPGVKEVYEAYKTIQAGLAPDLKERSQKLLEAYAKLNVAEAGAQVQSWLALARYNLYQQYYVGLTPAEQAENRDEWIKCVEAVLDFREDVQLRLDLAKLYADKGDFELAAEQILLAAEANTDTGLAGTAMHGQIKIRLDEAKKSGKYDKEILAKIDKALAAWTAAKDQEAREAAEAAKEQEKVDAELDKLSEEEAAKDKPKPDEPSGDR
jgi:hypothetical protein